MTTTRPLSSLLAFALLSLALAAGSRADEPADRSTLIATARAFHAAVESGELAKIAAFGCTAKAPFSEAEVRDAAKSVLGSLKKMRGRAWEFGRESAVKDAAGSRRLEVKTSPSGALLLTGIAFDGRWYLLSVDDLQPDQFAPRDPPLVDPAPTLQPAPALDAEIEKAVKDVVTAMARVPAAGDDASAWLLWRRHGIGKLPEALVGDLPALLEALRSSAAKPFTVEVVATGGAAPHRHARARVSVPTLVWSRWTILFIEAEGWKAVRAESEALSIPEPAPPEAAAKAVAAAESCLAAVDAADAKGFAARSVDLSGTTPRRPSEADVKAQLEALHGKYGARPHKVGAPALEKVRGRDGLAVPVLFGDAEDLLQLVLVEEGGEWLLASVSEGSPADFVERAR